MTASSFIKRKIPVSVTASDETIVQSLAAVIDHPAIRNVDFDRKRSVIVAEYNQLLIHYSGLLTLLSNHSINTRHSFGFSLRKSWYDYLDINTRENALAPPPACCNKPPK